MDWPSMWNSSNLVRTTQIVSPECHVGGWICSRKEKSRCSRVAQWWEDDQVADIHHQSGHLGVKLTLYFARLVDLQVSKETAKSVVKACEICRSIDPAPVHWKKGKLGVKDNWNRLVMDITHHNGKNFLTIIDCGPSRFAIWRPLRRQGQLDNVFLERGLLMEILTNNDTAFTSKDFREFARNWDVHLQYRCAYLPGGNGIVERSHRTVKTITARKNCSILEAIYWHVTPKDDFSPRTAPADMLHRYHVQIKRCWR